MFDRIIFDDFSLDGKSNLLIVSVDKSDSVMNHMNPWLLPVTIYCRFLFLRVYLILQFNRLASNREIRI